MGKRESGGNSDKKPTKKGTNGTSPDKKHGGKASPTKDNKAHGPKKK